MASLKQEKRNAGFLIHALLITGSLFMVFPFVWMISTSFKGPQEISGGALDLLPREHLSLEVEGRTVPLYEVAVGEMKRRLALMERRGNKGIFADPEDLAGEWLELPISQAEPIRKVRLLWENYSRAWNEQPFGRYYFNTILVALIVLTFQLMFSSLAAYAFAFFQFPFKEKIFLLLLGCMMIPQQALLVPNYVILAKLRWLDTYMALIVPWTASVYSVFFFRQFFMTLPKDLWDAARVDGCSRLGFYFRILLPLSKPPMVTLGIFSFLASWNSFIWPLIVTNSTHLRVLQVGLSYFMADAGTKWGQLMAASTFTILPLVIGYFVAQKWFVESQASTGLKE